VTVRLGATTKTVAANYARKAAAQAPDNQNKQNLESMVKSLSDGKPYNN